MSISSIATEFCFQLKNSTVFRSNRILYSIREFHVFHGNRIIYLNKGHYVCHSNSEFKSNKKFYVFYSNRKVVLLGKLMCFVEAANFIQLKNCMSFIGTAYCIQWKNSKCYIATAHSIDFQYQINDKWWIASKLAHIQPGNWNVLEILQTSWLRREISFSEIVFFLNRGQLLIQLCKAALNDFGKWDIYRYAGLTACRWANCMPNVFKTAIVESFSLKELYNTLCHGAQLTISPVLIEVYSPNLVRIYYRLLEVYEQGRTALSL